MRLQHRILALTIALLALAPAVASADMEIAMQDDLTVVDQFSDRDLLFDQFLAMGGTHVRIMYDHERGGNSDTSLNATRKPLEVYDNAVDAVIARGLTPQFTLFWRGGTSPKAWGKWAQTVAKHFAGRVDRYSIGNEPDLYEVEARKCTKGVQKALAKQFPKEIKGKRAKVLTQGGTVPLIDACNRYQRGVTYNKIFGPAAKGVRKGNRGAEVLAGETSPNRSLDWFFKSAKPASLDADGWAHHPFQFKTLTPAKAANNWGIGNYGLLKKQVRMPIYLTEFGYPRPASDFDRQTFGRRLTPTEVGKALPAAWRLARKKGAKQMLQYQWFAKPSFRTESWDTAILNDDDGTTTPAYDALKKLINSW
jgi:hypothetical protein